MALPLTDVARVQVYKSWAVDSERDTILAVIIAGVSARFEFEIKRDTVLQARSQDFDVDPGEFLFQVEAWPIDQGTNVVKVFTDFDRVFASASEIDADDFTVDEATGQVIVDKSDIFTGFRVLRITYDGGLAADLTGLDALRPDIVSAATRQVAFEYESRQRLGMRTQNLQSGDQVNYLDPGEWMSDMQRVIDQMRPAGIF